jgi:hypothetical protein
VTLVACGLLSLQQSEHTVLAPGEGKGPQDFLAHGLSASQRGAEKYRVAIPEVVHWSTHPPQPATSGTVSITDGWTKYGSASCGCW